MHRTRLLLLASLLFLLLHRTRAASCELAACGDITVKYPFWLGAPGQAPPPSASGSCGPPPFEVWCSNSSSNGSVASLRSSAIHVLRIDYGSSSFVASHSRVADGADGVCRTDYNMSSVIALSPFSISPTNRALCFLYDCNGTEPPTSANEEYVNATSTCGKPIFAYLGARVYDRDRPPAIPISWNCTYTFLPVLGSAAPAAAMTDAANYSQLLKGGFLLEWPSAVNGDCAGCEASEGQCRYNNDSAAFACLCPGGVLRGSTCAGEYPY